MTGEIVVAAPFAFAVRSGQLEAVKWLAVGFMFVDHFFRYVVGDVPGWAYLVGRLVFPLFVFAFAYGLGTQPWTKVRSALIRLFAWGAVAQASLFFVDAVPRLNVIFTFGLGLLAVYAIACGRMVWRVAAALVVVVLVGLFVEFGLWGVAFVFAVVWLARDDWRSRKGWILAGFALVALSIPNGSWFALVAVPVLLLFLRTGVEVPRIRGFFYWAYAGQFPLYAALSWVLR